MQSTLDKVGMGGILDDLETRSGQAAEIAAPKAKELFINEISVMSLGNTRNILGGPDDSTTRYFQSKSTPDLVEKFTSIVSDSLEEAEVIKSCGNAVDQYKKFPLVPDVKSYLRSYVVEKITDGIFHYLAVEEA